jgi:DNA-binding PadR family transcriptional regulator
LFVLGALARHGAMYGHQIRRDARVDRTELWSEVRPGSLYGALHRMAAEGLIETVRTEQVGNLPARTVYAITSEGRKELRALRAEAFRQVSLRPDPVDLAVAMSSDLPADELRGLVEDRHRALTTQREFFRHEQDRAWAEQTTADSLILQHAIGRLDAEIRWHEDLLLAIPMLSAVPAREDDPPEPPDRRSAPKPAQPAGPRPAQPAGPAATP